MDKKKLWLIGGAAALVLALGLILAFVLRPDHTPPEEAGEKAVKIGLCLRQHEEDPMLGQTIKENLMAAGFDVVLRDAMNDQSRQTEQVAALLKEDVSLMVIEPVITDAADETVALLMEKNVPGVFVGHKPEEAALQMWEKLSYVGSAQETLGALQGQIILQTAQRGDLNEDGQVSCLVISGPEDDAVAKLHAESCLNTLVTEGLLVEQIETSWGDWTLESGRARCAKALSQYGRDVEVIICGSESLTQGALEAIRSGGWQAGRDYCVVGVEAEDILCTENAGTVVWDLEGVAQQVLAATRELLTEGTAGAEYYVNLKSLAGTTDSQ